MKKKISNKIMEDRLRGITDDFSANYTDCIAGYVVPVIHRCDAENQAVEFYFRTAPWMKNTIQVLHGGITATILDISMGLLTMSYYDGTTLTPTVNMQISYLRPIPIDCDILVRARISHTGRSLCQTTAEIYSMNDRDKLYATATGTFYIIEE